MERTSKEIIREHTELIRGLISRVEKKSRNEVEIANLDRLRKRIALLFNTMGDDIVIVKMTPTMEEHSEKILERDEEFFLTVNAKAEYLRTHKTAPDSEDDFIFQLIDSIRGHYRKIPQTEKDEVYADVLKLFVNCIEYKKKNPSRF
jgi:hypothetical protein